MGWWLVGTDHLKPKGETMIDLPWIKSQNAPAWAVHIAAELQALQQLITGAARNPSEIPNLGPEITNITNEITQPPAAAAAPEAAAGSEGNLTASAEPVTE